MVASRCGQKCAAFLAFCARGSVKTRDPAVPPNRSVLARLSSLFLREIAQPRWKDSFDQIRPKIQRPRIAEPKITVAQVKHGTGSGRNSR